MSRPNSSASVHIEMEAVRSPRLTTPKASHFVLDFFSPIEVRAQPGSLFRLPPPFKHAVCRRLPSSRKFSSLIAETRLLSPFLGRKLKAFFIMMLLGNPIPG